MRMRVVRSRPQRLYASDAPNKSTERNARALEPMASGAKANQTVRSDRNPATTAIRITEAIRGVDQQLDRQYPPGYPSEEVARAEFVMHRQRVDWPPPRGVRVRGSAFHRLCAAAALTPEARGPQRSPVSLVDRELLHAGRQGRVKAAETILARSSEERVENGTERT